MAATPKDVRIVCGLGNPGADYALTRHNAGFATIDHNPMYSTETYAADWLEYYLGTESSILFLIDMDNRQLYIRANNGGGIGKKITASYCRVISDNVYSYASEGDYYTCAYKVFDQALTLLAGQRISQPMKYVCNALFAIAIGMILCYFLAKGTSSIRRTTDDEMLEYANKNISYTPPELEHSYTEKKYHPRSSGSGGGHGGGGGGGSHGGGHSF